MRIKKRREEKIEKREKRKQRREEREEKRENTSRKYWNPWEDKLSQENRSREDETKIRERREEWDVCEGEGTEVGGC